MSNTSEFEGMITEKDVKVKDEGVLTTYTLHLNEYMTKSLKVFKDYLKNHTKEEIQQHNKDYNTKELLIKYTQGFERRDMKVLKNSFTKWEREELLDDLYELEYRRFLDFKDDEKLLEIYDTVIFPFLRQGSEAGNRNTYTLGFGELGSIIDARIFSILNSKVIENKIDKFSLDGTDIFYFKSDRVEGVSRVIVPHKPVEIKHNWLPELLEELTGDDNCPLSRERRRSLKYHRNKLYINKVNYKGEQVNFNKKEHTPALMHIAVELFRNMESKKGDRYFIEVIPQQRDGFSMINTAIWELYYTNMTRNPGLIESKMEVEHPEGTLGVFSMGDLVESLKVNQISASRVSAKLSGEMPENPIEHRIMDSVCFCKAKIEEIDKEKERIKMRFSFREGGSAFVDKKTDWIPYHELYRETVNSNSGVKIFLPQTVYNSQKAFIPCDRSWDFIHPKSSSGIVFGDAMLEGSRPIHWDRQELYS